MTFQQQVQTLQGQGVVGDIMISGPQRGHPGILASADSANNVVGRFVTLIAGTDNNYAADAATGDGVYWGLLANSKEYALYGTAAGALEPTLILPNGIAADLLTMTSGVMVDLVANGATPIGGAIFSNTVDGTVAASSSLAVATPPAGIWTLIEGAHLVQNALAGAGQGIIALNGFQPITNLV
jgi:hypothetical protein